MKKQRPTANAVHEQHLIVVEAANYCLCHTLVRARKPDKAHWFFFFVPIRTDINFGDHLTFITDDQTPPDMNLFLHRGPTMKFRVRMDDIPVALLDRAMSELPWGRGDVDGT